MMAILTFSLVITDTIEIFVQTIRIIYRGSGVNKGVGQTKSEESIHKDRVKEESEFKNSENMNSEAKNLLQSDLLDKKWIYHVEIQ